MDKAAVATSACGGRHSEAHRFAIITALPGCGRAGAVTEQRVCISAA